MIRIDADTRLIRVLARYISPLMARAIVDRALGECGLDRAWLLPADVPRVVEKARVGIGIFCEPENLTALMLDLADLCDVESTRQSSPPQR